MAHPDAGHLDEIAVYNGRDRLGYVVEEAAEEWLALNDDDEAIGCYSTRKAAVDAVIVAGAGRPRPSPLRLRTHNQ